MINPYFCYALAFGVALSFYPLGWSDLYPPLSFAVVAFIVSTIALHIITGIAFQRKGLIKFGWTEKRDNTRALAITAFIYLLWVAEFYYAGGIPFVEILSRRTFDYKVFGIPTLHVFVVTFSSFYTILLFQQYLSTRSKKLLALTLVNLFAAVLIYNRGMFLFNVSACSFLFLIHKRRFTYAHVVAGLAALLLISYLFGVMGSLRVSNESRVPYSNEVFLSTGSATASFRNSGVPGEFFWVYVYTTSPLANLQQNIASNPSEDLAGGAFLKWFNNEVLPDFVSKRINRYAGVEKAKINTIQGPFNATTVYAGSYSYAGWWGLLLMALVILALPMLFVRVVPSVSPFYLSGLAIINTIFLFMIFDNTLRFTGLSFQLVYPILLHIGMQRVAWIKELFLQSKPSLK